MQIKRANKEEFQIAVQWAAEEGWNPGLSDLDAFFEADPNGFLLGYQDGVPMAAISVVKYSDDFGFLGFYIVDDKWRGQGHGFTIWNEGIRYLGHANIGLDGVVEQQDNYTKSGFQFAHNNIRFTGKAPMMSAANAHITMIENVKFEAFAAFDTIVFPAQRHNFLKRWLSDQSADRHSRCYYQDGVLKGFGTIRVCQEGHKIGPLFADNDEIAEALFSQLCHDAGADLVVLDVPEPNQAAMGFAHRLNMSETFQTARMYTKNAPNIDLQRIFGITTFELG